ncbi:unnamed protein product [Closterium sp. NIES-64]|nr:unnamed protein product [Closterium sp. NIES-64]
MTLVPSATYSPIPPTFIPPSRLSPRSSHFSHFSSSPLSSPHQPPFSYTAPRRSPFPPPPPQVIPFQKGEATQQPPPDLPSYLFKNRIVFLGMSLVPSVTELIMAELLYLQYDSPEKPIYMYINSTGTTKDGEKLGYETEAFAIYDTMRSVFPPQPCIRSVFFFSGLRSSLSCLLFLFHHLSPLPRPSYVKPPIFTLCVGNAWGEAALLLSAGSKGNRSALPSSSIMLKQPISRFRGQATDIDIMRKEVRNVKTELVKLYSRHTGKSEETIENDIRRPLYLTPDAAVEYGIIDKVLDTDAKNDSVVDSLRKRQLI